MPESNVKNPPQPKKSLTETVTVSLMGPIGQASQTVREFLLSRGLSARQSPANISQQSASGLAVPAPDGVEGDNNTRYDVGRLIARGGMGRVHHVHDMNIHRGVAMKVMLTSMKASDEQVLRFIQEAQITGQLEHPNIVPVHELAVADDSLFYTMKFVDGMTLDNVIRGWRKGRRRYEEIALDQMLTIFDKVCDAVAFAHAKGVVHRDLKPENIMLGDFGEVLVMDWGLAKVLAQGDSDAGDGPTIETVCDDFSGDPLKTMDNHLVGTPVFMAPEQAKRDRPSLDNRIDVYALGAILYNILTLQMPFKADNLRTLLELKNRGHVKPPEMFNDEDADLPHCPHGRIPEALSAVCMKALAVSPDRRYQSVKELQKDIQAYRTGYATTAEQAGLVRLLWLLICRNKSQFIVAGLSAVVILTILLSSVATVLDARQEAHEAQLKAGQLDIALSHLNNLKQERVSAPSESADFKMAQGNPFLGFSVVRYALLHANPDVRSLRFQPKVTVNGMALDLSDNPKLKDLSALKGLPLAELWLNDTAVEDLTALADMPLRYLSVANSKVTDVTPLAGMPLVFLDLSSTAVTDLGPIDGKSMVYLSLKGTQASSLAVLSSFEQLTALVLPEAVADIEQLRGLSNLTYLSYQDFTETSEQFWKAYDSRAVPPDVEAAE